MSCGILDRWAGDCHLGFWKGGDPDARLKGPSRYENMRTHRSASFRNFLVCNYEIDEPGAIMRTKSFEYLATGLVYTLFISFWGVIVNSERVEFPLSVSVALVSAWSRWRFPRCLETQREGHETQHGGIAYALRSFSEETDIVLAGCANFAESMIGNV